MLLRGSVAVLMLFVSSAFGYKLHVEASKTTLYQGEPVQLTYAFTYTPGDAAVDYRFAAPELAHFRVTERSSKQQEGAERTTWTKRYTVVPMQAGRLRAGTAAMNVAKRSYKKDAWGQWMPAIAWTQERFEPVTFVVLPAPSGVQAVGRFTLRAATDRNETESGKPVHLTLSLQGCGDLELAEALRMAVPGVDVFEEKTLFSAQWRGNCYYSERNQTFAFVADKDYTVPEVVLRSFDPDSGEVVQARSLPLEIKVNTTGRGPQRRIKEEESVGLIALIVTAVGGFTAGVVLTLLLTRRRDKTKRVRVDSLHSALIELLKHLDDAEARHSAEAMERHLYEGAEAPDDAALEKVLHRLRNRG